MSYTPTSWNNGDIITAEKLNKLENGVASGGDNLFEVFFEYDYDTHKFSSNKTAREICKAIIDGKTIIMYDNWNWVTASPIINGYFLPEDGEETYSEITLSYIYNGGTCYVYTVKDEDNETTVEYKETEIEELKLRVEIFYNDADGYRSMTRKGEVRSYNYHVEGSIKVSTGDQRITLSYSDALGFYYFLPSETPGQIILRSINYIGDDDSQQLQKTDYILTATTS